jgi:acetyl esterase/lipase
MWNLSRLVTGPAGLRSALAGISAIVAAASVGPSALGAVETSNNLGVGTWTWPAAVGPTATSPSCTMHASSVQPASNPTVSTDIPYNGALKLDVYRPGVANAPVVVYMHGGGWSTGDKGANEADVIPQDLSTRGLNAVSINYTLATQGSGYYPKQLQDVDCALRWVASHSSNMGFDARRIYLGGGSAGAHIALLYSLNQSAYRDPTCPYNVASPAVSKVFSWAGPTDLTKAPPALQRVVDNFLNGADASVASPITYANNSNGVQYLLINDKDDEVTVFGTQALPFYNKLLQWNPVTVQNKWYDTLQNGCHSHGLLDSTCSSFDKTSPDYPDFINTISSFLLSGSGNSNANTSVLTWTTTNANSASIDQGISDVTSQLPDGTATVSPLSISDRKTNPPVVGVRSSAEPAASSEAAPGTLPGLKPERQDACGGPIRACRGSATGVTANHALDARSGSSAGALARTQAMSGTG